jgi:hypothetical protein
MKTFIKELLLMGNVYQEIFVKLNEKKINPTGLQILGGGL